MLSVKTARLLVGILILSLVAGFFGWLSAPQYLQDVTQVASAEGTLVTLEETGSTARMIQFDDNGQIISQFRLPVTKGETVYAYEEILTDGGNVYLLGIQKNILSDQILAETVYRCNFERKRLETAWELPLTQSAQRSNLSVQVQKGAVTYFQTDYSGKQATANLYRLDGNGKTESLLSFSTDIGVGFTDFYYSASGSVVFSTPKGEIYEVQEKGTLQKRYPEKEGASPLLLFAGDGGDQLYFSGIDRTVYRMNLAEKAEPAFYFQADSLFPEGQGFAPENLQDLQFWSDGVMTAPVPNSIGESVAGIFRETELRTVRILGATAGQIWLRVLACFFGSWLLAGLVALLVRFFLFLTRGRFPVVTKLLAGFLPILVISVLVLNNLVTQIFTDNLVKQQVDRLYLLTSQQTGTLNAAYVRDMDMAKAFDSVYFYELRAALNLLPEEGTVYANADASGQKVYNSTYFWLYKLEGEKLISLICEQDYIALPVEERYPEKTAALFYQAVAEGRSISTDFQNNMGGWMVLLTPVVDENGQIVGVIETGTNRQALDYAVRLGAKQISYFSFGVLLVLGLLLSLILVVSLHPLKDLRQRVLEISDGKLGVQAKAKSKDEIGEIGRVFNQMSRNVAFRDKEIRLTSDGYSRFVPSRVFDLLEKSSVIDVELDDQTNVDATVLNCSVSSFDQIARRMRSKEMFRLINQVLAKLVPVVDQTGGLVDRFDRAGLLAVYIQNPAQALDAAVNLCATVRSVPAAKVGERALDFHVTLSAGPAMIGIVGAEKRLEAVTISEHTNFTGFLKPIALSYGATILVSGSAADRIPDFKERYHARTIGFVYMKSLEQMERLYDVFDGDDDTTRRLKEETLEQFEKGVTLFCARNYYDARLLFIEVLKKNREDKAAKQYLYLCDSRYQLEEDSQNIWIETY